MSGSPTNLIIDVRVAVEKVRRGEDDARDPVRVRHPDRPRPAPDLAARRVVRVVAGVHKAALQNYSLSLPWGALQKEKFVLKRPYGEVI